MLNKFNTTVTTDILRDYMNHQTGPRLCMPHLPYLRPTGSGYEREGLKQGMTIREAVDHSRKNCASDFAYMAIHVYVLNDKHTNILLFARTGPVWVIEPNGHETLDPEMASYMRDNFHQNEYVVVEHSGIQSNLGEVTVTTQDFRTTTQKKVCRYVQGCPGGWWLCL